MRKTLAKATIVFTVFILTILITSKVINKEFTDRTVNIKDATYPTVSIEYNGVEINRLYAYVDDMELSYMRECITPLMSGRRLHLDIDTYSSLVSSLKYEVRTVDSTRLIEDSEITQYTSVGRNIEANLVLKDLIGTNTEYEFILIITLEDGQELKYYTRVINPDEYYVSDKLEYVLDFSQKTFDKNAAIALKTYLEPNSLGDNTSFGHVDIHSSVDMVSWGELRPNRVSTPVVNIRELSKSTGSFILDYVISITDSDNYTRFYNVREFFRIRYGKERMYLLDYERTTDEIFENSKASFTDQSISLGIISEDVNVVENEDGSAFAFVTGDRLYAYSVPKNEIVYIFGDYEGYTEDERLTNNHHRIKIMDVDESGNVTFLVYGYMNRGDHEGECGSCAYYYDASINTLEELVFVPSSLAPDVLMARIEQLSFLNSDRIMYLLMGDTIYAINVETLEVDEVVGNLSEGSYVISDNNHLVAWMNSENRYDCQEITLVNLETGRQKAFNCGRQQTLKPIGFIVEDLIYGTANKEDITRDRSGSTILPMYEVKIVNENDGDLMTYSREGIYVIGGEVHGNQITLSRISHLSEGYYVEELDDQIMNSSNILSYKNSITYRNDAVFKKLASISLSKDIKSQSVKRLTPRLIKPDEDPIVEIKAGELNREYVVYGRYGVHSMHMDPAEAVIDAYNISGIVMNRDGGYVYRKVALSSKNQIMAIREASVTEDRGALAVCMDSMLEYVGVIRNSQYMLSQDMTVLEILEDSLTEYEVLDLTGCEFEMVLYYVDQDIPVLALMDNGGAYLIVGFNEDEVVLMDPEAGDIHKISREDADRIFDENGNCFITVLRK